MFDFRKLLKLLEKELSYQEKLLEVLSKERVAIVKLNQDDLDQLNMAKMDVLNEVMDIEGRRKEIFFALQKEAKREEPLRFDDVVALCPPSEGRGQLKHVGDNLRRIATNVKEMNDANGALIKQSLGLIASTLSIMQRAPDVDLPTYTQNGKLTTGTEDPAFASRSQVRREA